MIGSGEQRRETPGTIPKQTFFETEAQGKDVISDLLARGRIGTQLEHPGNNFAETGSVVVSRRFKYIRVED
jgi:hypothetical protein